MTDLREQQNRHREERRSTEKSVSSIRSAALELDSGWYLASFIAIGLWLAAPKVGQLLTVIGLLAMVACLLHPISHLKWVCRGDSKKKKTWKFRGLMAVATVAIAGFGFFVWPPTPYYHNLSRDEIMRFNNTLGKPPAGGERVRLGCPPSSEDICVFAGQFLPLFQRAGWTVEGNAVDRIIVGKPTSGVTLFLHGEGNYDPSNPDQGLWTALTKGRIQIGTALTSISLPPNDEANPVFPSNVVGIYFGVLPKLQTKNASYVGKIHRVESNRKFDAV